MAAALERQKSTLSSICSRVPARWNTLFSRNQDEFYANAFPLSDPLANFQVQIATTTTTTTTFSHAPVGVISPLNTLAQMHTVTITVPVVQEENSCLLQSASSTTFNDFDLSPFFIHFVENPLSVAIN